MKQANKWYKEKRKKLVEVFARKNKTTISTLQRQAIERVLAKEA